MGCVDIKKEEPNKGTCGLKRYSSWKNSTKFVLEKS